jgi:colicin import membrane protein
MMLSFTGREGLLLGMIRLKCSEDSVMGVQKESGRLGRGKVAAIVAAVVVGVALVAIGVGLGVRAHAESVARAREAQAVAAARADCRKSVAVLRDAKTAFASASNAKSVAAASRITAGQVDDGKTVDRLKGLLSDDTSFASCTVSSRAGLERAAKANRAAAEAVSARRSSLGSAADAVSASKKRLDDRKAEEAKARAEAERKKAAAEAKRRADEARQAEAKRKAEQAAAARAQAQARYRARHTYRYQARRTYTPRRNTGTYSGGNGSTDHNPPKKQTNDDDDWVLVNGGHHEWYVYGGD